MLLYAIFGAITPVMKILSIETSCDETGIAVVEGEKTAGGFEFKIVKNALLSQAKLHAEYGGVFPNLAKREHQKNLPVLFEQFNGERKEVDAVAVTAYHGLEPALWTGVVFAQQVAKEWKKPLLPMHHIEGHLISSLVQEGRLENVQLPVLALVISGGDTEFILMREWFKYEVIGETLDDAVGEAFDKVARMLGLSYPGGPEISKLAERVSSACEMRASVTSVLILAFVSASNVDVLTPCPATNSCSKASKSS